MVVDEIFSNVMPLKSSDKLQLVDKILASLTPADKQVEKAWAEEVEERLEIYGRGLLSAVDEDKVFSKYQK